MPPRTVGLRLGLGPTRDRPPLRIFFFGAGPLEMIKDEYENGIANWERWNDVFVAAHGKPEKI
ncbi:MAG TPA: hypothetical protein VGY54_21030 [Polyangiaceae bacterium]|nr:hypothetical protein [Polyangiaceae bacterium]